MPGKPNRGAHPNDVVVVRREAAADVVEKSRAREAKEDETRARLKAGELGIDFYGMREKLKAKGLKYI